MTQKSIVLSGVALAVARDLLQLAQAHNRELERLRAEFQRAEEVQRGAIVEAMRNLMDRAGLESQKPEEWYLDVRWLAEHGIAILAPLEQIPDTDNPLHLPSTGSVH